MIELTLKDYYLKYHKKVKNIEDILNLDKKEEFDLLFNNLLDKNTYINQYVKNILMNYHNRFYAYYNKINESDISDDDGFDIICNNNFIIGYLSKFENVGKQYLYNSDNYYNKGLFCLNNVFNIINELVSPFSSLLDCIIIDLLEKYYNKTILDLVRERIEIITVDDQPKYIKGFFIRRDLPKVIINDFVDILQNSEVYLYYLHDSFNKKWIIYRAKIIIITECSITVKLLDSSRIVEIYYHYSNKKWLIAFDKEMLKKQLESIKIWGIKKLSSNFHKSQKEVDRLESLLIKKKKLKKEYIDNYKFEEDKINIALNDGKTI